MVKVLKNIPEAPESNAGDNFHVLWTIKKSFDLLNFDDEGLKAITVEGVFRGNKLDPTGEQLLGVDITEYFGGDRLENPNKVIISQLKYSSRRENENWTFSKIYTGKKGNKDGSIIHRLAKTYKVYLKNYCFKKVAKKLTFKLVSNRNFNSQQKQYLKRIQEYLKTKKTKTKFNTIYKNFPEQQDALKKLYDATELSSTEFTEFIKLFDVDDCGTGSNIYQEIEIIKAIKSVGIHEPHQMDSLFRMVWKKMLPDAVEHGNNIITEIDFLHIFSMSKESLFPVQQRFEEIKNLIPRIQLNDIIRQIEQNNSGVPICIHGRAGIGKSSLTQLLGTKLNKNSAVILFDCYGAGAYLNPSDNRQLHKEALLHICNEMAKKISSSFLLAKNNDQYIFLREFKQRVEQAVKILKARDKEALLLLIIDAADNSVVAAQKNQTDCFVHDLVLENYVPGFRLVLTSRSHRVDTLRLPESYIDIPIKAFEYSETKKLLKHHFPDCTDEEIAEFHKLTNGIPRVQAYALDAENKEINNILDLLRPNGKIVETLIQDKIVDAGKRLGHEGAIVIKKIFEYLVLLPRPVPLSYLAKLTEVSEEIIIDLTTDIWHGLRLDSKGIVFSDEDFETYITDNYTSDSEVRIKIAKLLLSKADEDDYAAINLGSSLLDAQLHQELIDIVLNEQLLNTIGDPLRKKEVYIKRTTLAMQVCNKIEDKLSLMKLAFIAANTSKTKTALKELLASNVELVASFGDTLSLNEIERENILWGGSFHYQMAAVLARNNESIEIVKHHLKTARKWINWLQNQKDSRGLRPYRISDKDIALGAEAILRTMGAKEAFIWMNRWQPIDAVYKSFDILIDNVLKTSNSVQLSNWLSSIDLPLFAQMVIIRKLGSEFIEPQIIINTALKVVRILTREIKLKKYLFPELLALCEILCATAGKDAKNLVVQILSHIDVSITEHIPSFLIDHDETFKDERINVDIFLRKTTLLKNFESANLELKDIYPEQLRDIDKEPDYKTRRYREEEKQRFDRFYSIGIEIYQLKADVYLNKVDQNTIEERIKNICQKVKNNFDLRYYDRIWLPDRLRFLANILIDILPNLPPDFELLKEVAESFEVKDKTGVKLRIELCDALSRFKEFHPLCIKLLNEAIKINSDSLTPSSEIVGNYIDSAKVALNFHKGLARSYFDKAVEAVTEVDIEAQAQIKCLSALAKNGIKRNSPELAFNFARFIEHCNIRLEGYDNFPIDTGIEGIANLDCSSVFAILCRWTHRYRINLPEKILIALEECLLKNYISSDVAMSMLPINIYYWRSYVGYIKVLIEKLNYENNSSLKNLLMTNVLRDIKINCSPHEKFETIKSILGLIEDGRYLDRNIINDFKNYAAFLASFKNDKKEQNTRARFKDNKIDTEPNIYLDDIDIISTSSLTTTIKRIQNKEGKIINTSQINNLFDQLKQKCLPEQYVAHLDAIININPSLLSIYSLEHILKTRLEDWREYPEVSIWAKNSFKRFLALWFGEFYYNDYISFSDIKKFASYFKIELTKVREIIVKILPQLVETLSAEPIYQTIIFLNEELSPKKNQKLIKWALIGWSNSVKNHMPDGDSYKSYLPAEDNQESIASTIRFILANPDKRIRWRGIHSIRRLVKSGNLTVLELLLKYQNKKDCHSYQDKNNIFFWMSAKLYLWICIFRLSQEFPEILKKYSSIFIEELQNQELPHALIKYYVKKTCLNLLAHDNKLFSDSEIKTIDNTLKNKISRKAKEKDNRTRQNDKNKKERWKFSFDSMDTLPYWYSHLAECFDLSSYDIADLADSYITEKWGHVGSRHEGNYVQADYTETSHRHGSLPLVENVPLYFEYHALFCAANDLLESIPLKEDDEESWRKSWDDWISSHAQLSESGWLSDLRSPIPETKLFWVNEFSDFDKNWEKHIEEQHYDNIVGFINNNSKFIIPHGEFTRYFGKNYENVSISSALVSLSSAESLLRTLQTTNNCYDYNIPTENDGSEIFEDKFELIGWLSKNQDERSEIEKDDPFVNDIRDVKYKFSGKVESAFNIEYSKDEKQAFYKDQLIAKFDNWNDIGKHLYYSELRSSGSVFHVKCSFILDVLQKTKMCMIISCHIYRNLDDNEYDESINKNVAKLYLIYSDGKVKTLARGNFKIG